MKVIKRTSPGPKIGPTGSSIGAKKSIGTTGTNKTTTSTAGGQYPFMPSPKSTPSTAKDKPGQVSNPKTENYFSFMPRKAGGK